MAFQQKSKDNDMKHVAIGCDHAAFELKQLLKQYLLERGYRVLDVGVEQAARCDYPDYAAKVCAEIRNGTVDWGVLLCGTGIGMSMAANKFPNIRAAVVSDCFSAAATRQHNDANVLCLGSRVVGIGLAKQILDSWCGASFEGGRHQARIDKMMNVYRGEP